MTLNKQGKSIECDLLHDKTVNFAIQQNHVPIVKHLKINNSGSLDLKDITITISAEPQFASKWEKHVSVISTGETLDIGKIDICLSPTFLANNTERTAGYLTLSLNESNVTIFSSQYPIEILAFDEWSGIRSLPEIIAAFVTPNQPEIAKVLRASADLLGKWTENSSLDGYQSKSPQRIRLQLAAIYCSLQQIGIAYCVPPASFEETGQKIRSVDTIFSQRLGTCLDLTVLFASCAEAAGLNPIVIFVEGHSFIGVWQIEETFIDAVYDDITSLTKRIAYGTQEICIIETVAFASEKKCSFDEAVKLAEQHLSCPEKFHFFVDIKRARIGKIKPLPYKINGKFPDDVFNIDTNDNLSQTHADNLIPEMPQSTATILDESQTNLDESQTKNKERTRLDQWKRSLLDLTLRNTLINFRVTAKCIPLLTSDFDSIEDNLASGKEFQVLPRPSDWQIAPPVSGIFQPRIDSNTQKQILHDELLQNRLHADLTEKELTIKLTHLFRSARTSIEENGANTLFMALGTVIWYESESSENPKLAPILLVPIEIVRKSVKTGFVIRKTDDETQLNVTLFEKLKADFGIEITGLNPLPTDDHGIDVKTICAIIRRAIINKSRWDISESAYLGLFSFSKFVMWHDIKTRSEQLKQNKIVSGLISGHIDRTSYVNIFSGDDPDKSYHPKDIVCPLSSDSSQLKAIYAAGAGNSIVLHGPPGTGKSQTITNMIAHVLAQGKTVLFVAEKIAALTVVQRRLKKIGLSPFCLEIHSNKSNKKNVLDQLKNTLESDKIHKPHSWEREANRLALLRTELNDYVKALHKKRSVGHSVFRGIAVFSTLYDAPKSVVFESAWVAEITPEKFENLKNLTRQLKVAAKPCGNIQSNAWNGSCCEEYSPQLKSQIAVTITSLSESLSQWESCLSEVAKLFGVKSDSISYKALDILMKISDHFLAMPMIPGEMLGSSEWDNVQKSVISLINHGLKRDNLYNDILSRYSDTVLKLDVKQLKETLEQSVKKWFIPKFFDRHKVAKNLKHHMKSGHYLNKSDLENEISKLQNLLDEESFLSSQNHNAKKLLGINNWNDGKADWDIIGKALEWTSETKKLATNASDASHAERLCEKWSKIVSEKGLTPELSDQLNSYIKAGKESLQLIKVLKGLISADISLMTKHPKGINWFHGISSRLKNWENNLDGLHEWCAWYCIRQKAIKEGLKPLISAYETGCFNHEYIEDAFLRGFYKSWIEYEITNDKPLKSFSRNLFEDKISQFRELDQTFSTLTAKEIYARLASRVPESYEDSAQSSETGILAREFQKQKNHMALRALIGKIPNLLMRLKPCLLMSPISVAQYLDPSQSKFDLVIFDEASQVPTCDAVGAIARGREAIIVGDPKQLPPTTFFSSMSSEYDDDIDNIQDLESILDDCIAIRMPEEQLKWHYRSRHESLIAFSNYQYYENKLLTFPSPDDFKQMVRLVQVQGVYDRGKSKQNKAEAEAIINEIVRRLSDDKLNSQSIGVVTFSSAQQKLIEDLLDEKLRQQPELEEYFLPDKQEPVFVKNLENVQGDERDVILFSIGYGPDAQGRVSLNFGPLNKSGGWRRLNVAVSRARHEMIVFSTLRPEQLDISRTNAKGVSDLKAFLEYASRGKGSLSSQISSKENAEHDSLFEEQVYKKLLDKGHKVHAQVGCSGYRIDLAIVDPVNAGRYVIGIECDGATYHRAKTARDRDKLREEILRNLGWQIHRVWSTDWWENPERELNRIEDAIKKALEVKSSEVKSSEVKPLEVKALEVKPPIQTERFSQSVDTMQIQRDIIATRIKKQTFETEYKVCKLQIEINPDNFYLPEYDKVIAKQITKVIETEGPISYNLLCKRVINAWSINKVGSRINTRLFKLCDTLKLKTTEYNGLFYYWPESVKPASYKTYRTYGNDTAIKRDIKEIPPEEIANAAHEVLKNQISLHESDLIRTVLRVFGFNRIGAALEQHISYGISCLIEQKRASKSEDGRIKVL